MSAQTTEALFLRYGPRYRGFVSFTVLLGAFATVISTTIINVAVPDIMGAFGMGQDQAQWLVSGFLIAMTSTMLLNAWMISTFGQRKAYIGALGIFLAASLIGGISPNETVVIATRIIQGCAAGILQPLAMYTLFRVYPADQRGSAMSIYGLGVVLGPALGPTLGGLTVDYFNWRYVFYVSVPICVLGIFLATLFMPEREETGPAPRFDWIGFGLMVAFLSCLLIGLSNGQRYGWESDYIVGLLLSAAGAGLAFVAWESWTPEPMLDLRLFAYLQFSSGALVAFILGMGIFGSTYLAPLFAQTIQHMTPTEAGLMLMPSGVALAVLYPFTGPLGDRLPPQGPILAGLLLFVLSSILLAEADVNTGFWPMAMALALGRAGIGISFPALNVGALRVLPAHFLSQGSGMINFVRMLGGAFGVNLLSITLDRRTAFHKDAFSATQESIQGYTGELLTAVQNLLAQGGASEALRLPGAAHFLNRVIQGEAAAAGFKDSYLAVALLFAMAVIPAWMMGRSKRPRIA